MSPMPEVRLTAKGWRWQRSGHPWIYRDDLAASPPELPGGSLVRVLDHQGRFLGQACYSAKSRISLRFLTYQDEALDRDFWAARLLQARDYRGRVVAGTDAFRLVFGEADGFPGLIADTYAGHLVLQVLHPGMEGLLPELLPLLKEYLDPRSLTLRNDVEVRGLEGLPQEVATIWGEPPPLVEVAEGGVRFLVDLKGGQKTGLFLDQRENRLAAGAYARGEALDCFSYQGGFALHLARQCQKVTLVEASQAALSRAQENARLNGFNNLEPVKDNVFSFLKEAVAAGRRFHLIVLDPPAFAKSRRDRESAVKGYHEINRRAFQLLYPGGTLITCSCSYNLGEPDFLELVRKAAADAHRQARLIERRGAARDHPALLSLPESLYLKCFILEAR